MGDEAVASVIAREAARLHLKGSRPVFVTRFTSWTAEVPR